MPLLTDLTAEEQAIYDNLVKLPAQEIEAATLAASNEYDAACAAAKRKVLVVQSAYDAVLAQEKLHKLTSQLNPAEKAQLHQLLAAKPIESQETVTVPE